MIRVLLYVFVAAVLALLCGWFASNPGEVEITFLDYQISTSLPVFLLVLILLFVLIKIVMLPFSFGDAVRAFMNRRESKEKHKIMLDYLTAVGEGNIQKYEALAGRVAKVFSHEPELKNLMLLNITSGIKKAEVLENLASEKGTKLLALKHQIDDAGKSGKTAALLELYQQVFAEYPKAKWVVSPYLNLLSLFQKWDEILKVAKEAFKRRAVDKKTYLMMASSAMLEKGLAKSGSDENASAELILEAAKMCPDNAAAGVQSALVLAQKGQRKKAMRVLTKLWKKSASTLVYDAMNEVLSDAKPYDKIKAITRAVAGGKYKAFNNIVLADAYAKAALWGPARELADKYLALYPSSAYGAKVMSEICEGDTLVHSDKDMRFKELASEKIDELKPFVCSACGARYNRWHSVCDKCKNFARITVFLGGE